MRTRSTAATAALACLALGAAVAGCTHGATAKEPSASEEPSAQQMLDAANDAMKALSSVTIDANAIGPDDEDRSTRLRTDLKGRCAYKTTWTTGPSIEQIRIGETDYVRTNRAYDEQWPSKDAADPQDQDRWSKVPAGEAEEGNGLADCTWDFASFGVAKKREPTEVNGKPAIRLVVADTDEGVTYNFYIAAKGKPYILKVVYESAEYHSITTFSAFDEPLDVRRPDLGG